MDSAEARKLLEAAKTPEEKAAAQAAIVAAILARPRTLGFGKAPRGGWTEADRIK